MVDDDLELPARAKIVFALYFISACFLQVVGLVWLIRAVWRWISGH